MDYQYGEYLRALGGCPRSFLSRNNYGSVGATKEQTSGESTNYSPVQGTFPVASVEDTNPSKQVEVESENLRELPTFQEDANVEVGRTDDVQDGNSLQLVLDPVCEGTDVELMRVVTGQLVGVILLRWQQVKLRKQGLELKLVDWIRGWRWLGLVL